MRSFIGLSLSVSFLLFAGTPQEAFSQASSRPPFVRPEQFLEALPPELVKNLKPKASGLTEARLGAQKRIADLPKNQTGTFRLKIDSINKKSDKSGVWIGYLAYHTETLRVGGTPFSLLCEVMFGTGMSAEVEKLKPGKAIEVTGTYSVSFVPAEVDKTAAGLSIHIDATELK